MSEKVNKDSFHPHVETTCDEVGITIREHVAMTVLPALLQREYRELNRELSPEAFEYVERSAEQAAIKKAFRIANEFMKQQ